MKPKLVGLLSAIFLSASATADLPNEEPEIQELYRRGVKGDKAAVEECIARLEVLLKGQPGNQLGRVYLGSAYTLRSRDLGFGPRKLSTLKQGLAMMDKAVAAAADNPKVLLARALTTSALPSIFGRAASSRRDFELLAEAAQRSPAKFEDGDLQVIYYQAGLAAKAAGDRARAVALWRMGLRYPEDAALARKIEQALEM